MSRQLPYIADSLATAHDMPAVAGPVDTIAGAAATAADSLPAGGGAAGLSEGGRPDSPAALLPDSLAAALPDSSGGEQSDSLIWSASPFGRFGIDLPAEEEAPQTVTAEELFGETSQPVVQPPVPWSPPVTAEPLFQTLVVVLAGAYMLFVSRHFSTLYLLLTRIFSDKAEGNRLFDSHGGILYNGMLNTALCYGLAAAGTLAVRFAAGWFPLDGAAAALSAVVSLLAAASLCFGFGMLKLIGAVTLSRDFTNELIRLRQRCAAWSATLLTPALLLLALMPAGRGTWLLYVVAVEAVAGLWLFLQKSSRLFLSKKVSIFHWFLYLCSVEIFPVSLICLLPVRL